MLLTLGIGSAVSMVNSIVTIVCDEYPKINKMWVTAGLCGGAFLFGLMYCTPVSPQHYTNQTIISRCHVHHAMSNLKKKSKNLLSNPKLTNAPRCSRLLCSNHIILISRADSTCLRGLTTTGAVSSCSSWSSSKALALHGLMVS